MAFSNCFYFSNGTIYLRLVVFWFTMKIGKNLSFLIYSKIMWAQQLLIKDRRLNNNNNNNSTSKISHSNHQTPRKKSILQNYSMRKTQSLFYLVLFKIFRSWNSILFLLFFFLEINLKMQILRIIRAKLTRTWVILFSNQNQR